MAAKKKTAKTDESVVALDTIVAAGEAGMFVPEDIAMPLVEQGLVEVNADMADEHGNIATRATHAGIDACKPKEVAPREFPLETGVPIPETKRGAKPGESVYPFDKMEIGQSFFIAATEEKPEPAKNFASVVSSANRRYSEPDPNGAMKINRKGDAVPVMIPARKFIIRAVEENGVAGARVWRVEID